MSMCKQVITAAPILIIQGYVSYARTALRQDIIQHWDTRWTDRGSHTGPSRSIWELCIHSADMGTSNACLQHQVSIMSQHLVGCPADHHNHCVESVLGASA